MTDQTNPRYLVRKVETCPVCHGEKFVQNEDWRKINEENSAWMKEHTGGIFTDEAYNDWDSRIAERWPYGNPPIEDEPCCECEATGQIERWVDLRQVMHELAQAGGWIEAAPPSGDAP